MGAPHRCYRCNIRHSLRKRVDLYVRQPRCPSCRGPLHFDNYRALKEHQRRDKEGMKVTCTCGGYHFPHRRRSLWCRFYPGERTEAHFEARFPRSHQEMVDAGIAFEA